MIDFLFFLIITSYSYPLIYIIKNFNKNSVSDIICIDKCRIIIFKYFLNMCIFLLIYELWRFNLASFIVISLFCLIFLRLLLTDVNTNEHYFYAYLLFATLFAFMLVHLNKSKYLLYITLLYSVLSIITIVNIYYNNSILYSESFLMIIFCIYFTILHTIEYK